MHVVNNIVARASKCTRAREPLPEKKNHDTDARKKIQETMNQRSTEKKERDKENSEKKKGMGHQNANFCP